MRAVSVRGVGGGAGAGAGAGDGGSDGGIDARERARGPFEFSLTCAPAAAAADAAGEAESEAPLLAPALRLVTFRCASRAELVDWLWALRRALARHINLSLENARTASPAAPPRGSRRGIGIGGDDGSGAPSPASGGSSSRDGQISATGSDGIEAFRIGRSGGGGGAGAASSGTRESAAAADLYSASVPGPDFLSHALLVMGEGGGGGGRGGGGAGSASGGGGGGGGLEASAALTAAAAAASMVAQVVGEADLAVLLLASMSMPGGGGRSALDMAPTLLHAATDIDDDDDDDLASGDGGDSASPSSLLTSEDDACLFGVLELCVAAGGSGSGSGGGSGSGSCDGIAPTAAAALPAAEAAVAAVAAVAVAPPARGGGWRPRFMQDLAAGRVAAHVGVAPPAVASECSTDSVSWVGVMSDRGGRPYMEDRYTCLPCLPASRSAAGGGAASFFAIFDGHAGAHAAEYASLHLHEGLELAAYNASDDPGDACVALEAAFAAVEAALLAGADASAARAAVRGARARSPASSSGATALAVLLRGNQLVVGHLGDCRAVLGCADGSAVQLTADHTPLSERRRIEAAGGWLVSGQEMHVISLGRRAAAAARAPAAPAVDAFVRYRAEHEPVRTAVVARVCGDLAVARALGDPDYKGIARMAAVPWDWPDDAHPRTFSADLVLATPDVHFRRLRAADAFLLLACDGLWEVLTSAEAVTQTARYLREGLTPTAVSARLVALAAELGASDNITVILVLLTGGMGGGGHSISA